MTVGTFFLIIFVGALIYIAIQPTLPLVADL